MKSFMKILSILLFFIISFSCSNELPSSKLQEKNGLVYKVNKKKPYTGKAIDYYDNGQKMSEIIYKNGLKEGLNNEWYETGSVKLIANFVEGKKHGLFSEFNSNGQKLAEGIYADDLKNGTFNEWYENGQKKSEIVYQMGEKIDPIKEWDPFGNKYLERTQIDSIIQKVKSLPEIPVNENEKAIIETNLGFIELEFFKDVAPRHCANFKKLANSGFYNGTTFHRIVPGFVIQGGDILSRDNIPGNDGSGDAGYKIKAEFNNIHHDRGIVSMARGADVNSAGSQFFIMLAPKHHLDRQYTAFARVTKGMEVVDAIAESEKDRWDRPLERIVMGNVKVVEK